MEGVRYNNQQNIDRYGFGQCCSRASSPQRNQKLTVHHVPMPATSGDVGDSHNEAYGDLQEEPCLDLELSDCEGACGGLEAPTPSTVSVVKTEDQQEQLIEALRIESDKLLQMDCPSPYRAEIMDTVNSIIQSSRKEFRTDQGDDAARSLPHLLRAYADQCQSRLQAERNTMSAMQEREQLLAASIVERDQRIETYKRVVEEFEEAQFHMATLQEAAIIVEMDPFMHRDHSLAMIDARKQLELKREQCNKILHEHSACQQAASETNRLLKRKVEEKEKELQYHSRLASEELERVARVTKEIRRVSYESFLKLQDDLRQAKNRLDDCTRDMMSRLEESQLLATTCDTMVKMIEQHRENTEDVKKPVDDEF